MKTGSANSAPADGFTLIELMVVLVMGAIGLFAIGALVTASYRDLTSSRLRTNLQTDADLASYTIKGILEEADTVAISDGGVHVTANYGNDWMKEFYPDPSNGADLIFKDSATGNTEKVITTLSTLGFAPGTEPDEIVVTIGVQGGAIVLQNSFSVFPRN